jgi:ParB-like chromosome segregation protein Spo0J
MRRRHNLTSRKVAPMSERSERSSGRTGQAEKLPPHPLATKWIPPPTDWQYEALKADVDENGLADPRIYRYEGKVLDGNTRQQVAWELGIERELEFIDFDPDVDDDPEAFVISKNVARRHLTTDQLADVVAELRSRGMTQADIAKGTGKSKRTVGRVLKRPVKGQTPFHSKSQVRARQEQPKTITNKLGRTRPASYKPRSKSGVKKTPTKKLTRVKSSAGREDERVQHLAMMFEAIEPVDWSEVLGATIKRYEAAKANLPSSTGAVAASVPIRTATTASTVNTAVPPRPERVEDHPPSCSCWAGCEQARQWEQTYGGVGATM